MIRKNFKMWHNHATTNSFNTADCNLMLKVVARRKILNLGAFQNRQPKKCKLTRHQPGPCSYSVHIMWMAFIHVVQNMVSLGRTSNLF